MDEILLLLLRRGAHIKSLRMTTSEIGMLAGMSQQNASRKLAQLERSGYLTRRKDGLRLSPKAYDELAGLYSALRSVFEGEKLEIEGVISRGLGEGRYYVSMEGYRKRIAEKLGFDPYPGTLNIKVDESQRWKRQQLLQTEPVIIPGFKDKNRTYGDIFAYPCTIEGRGCALIIPLRTHHGPEVLEVLCPFNIKKELGKGEGDLIKVLL
ncbi:MAG: DUF120 domain-containing protein [Candidatus Micrarchaeota archaeon]